MSWLLCWLVQQGSTASGRSCLLLADYLLTYRYHNCNYKFRQSDIKKFTMPRPKKNNAKREVFQVRLTSSQKDKLRKYAEREGISMAQAIEKFIEGVDID